MFDQILEMDNPTQDQRSFAQTYIITLAMKVINDDEKLEEEGLRALVPGDSNEEKQIGQEISVSEQIKRKLSQLKDMKPTQLNCCAIQVLILILFMKKDLQESEEMIRLFIAFIKQRKDLPKTVLRDMFWLIGRHVCKLIKPVELSEELNINSA